MTPPTDTSLASPLEYPRQLLRRAWRDALSVYYANTPIWRVLKSGALLVFGFFCWSASNLLLSYRPDWGFLWYVTAYGFVLILWGPLTHLVILPAVIRLRRSAEHPAARAIARNGSKLNLSVFLVIVLVLGTAPIAPMTLEFTPDFGDDSGPDVNPDLDCTQTDELIACDLSSDEGIDHVVVSSGGETLLTDDEPPFEWEIREDELEEVVGQKQFVVELRDAEGNRLRQYVRTAGSF